MKIENSLAETLRIKSRNSDPDNLREAKSEILKRLENAADAGHYEASIYGGEISMREPGLKRLAFWLQDQGVKASVNLNMGAHLLRVEWHG